MREFLVGLALLACLLAVSAEDRASAEVTAKIVAASPRPITHYTIKQDSPGLERGYEGNPFPLTSPMQERK